MWSNTWLKTSIWYYKIILIFLQYQALIYTKTTGACPPTGTTILVVVLDRGSSAPDETGSLSVQCGAVIQTLVTGKQACGDDTISL